MSDKKPFSLKETIIVLSVCAIAPVLITLACGYLLTAFPVHCAIVICDSNPPVSDMKEFYEAHREDFKSAISVLQERETGIGFPAPEEIKTWAGSEARLTFCTDKDDPPAYEIETAHGTFVYIPNQTTIPTGWNPCTGIIMKCFDKIDDEWFRCSRTID